MTTNQMEKKRAIFLKYDRAMVKTVYAGESNEIWIN